MNAISHGLKRLGHFVIYEYDRLFAGLYLIATLSFLYIFLQ